MRVKLLITCLYIALVESPACPMLVTAFSSHKASLSTASSWNRRFYKQSHQYFLSRQRLRTKTERSTVFLREPSKEETSIDEEEASPKSDEKSPVAEATVRKVVKQIGKVVVYGFSYFMNVVGLYFTIGLLLNIFGYAYEFSFKEGYKIDTIKNKRVEQEFERESRRYEKERKEKLSRLSIGMATDGLFSETVQELAASTSKGN
jgi:hypothetical protein